MIHHHQLHVSWKHYNSKPRWKKKKLSACTAAYVQISNTKTNDIQICRALEFTHLDYHLQICCDKLIKMVNFTLDNEMWRWINQHDMSVGQRKIRSPRQESNPWPPKHRVGALSTELRELITHNLSTYHYSYHIWTQLNDLALHEFL